MSEKQLLVVICIQTNGRRVVIWRHRSALPAQRQSLQI